MIELFLSSDGKHTVHVSADTPEQLRELVLAAKALYQDVLATYGTKAQMWGDAIQNKGNGNSQATVGKRADTVEQAQAVVAPLCPVHQKPMSWQQGAFGQFWSCHIRNPNGEWCTSKQRVAAVGNGHSNTA